MILTPHSPVSQIIPTFAVDLIISKTMRKQYSSAPLPFMGQKRRFAKEFVKVLKAYPDGTTFVDLFGGSGLLSHIAKCQKPNSKVVFNDFDNYRQRLAHITQTNAILSELRTITAGIPRNKAIIGEARERVFQCLSTHEQHGDYIDFITLSSNIMFSMKYRLSIEAMRKESLFNNIRLTDYPDCSDYLEGLTITSCDYKELFEQYCGTTGTVFLVDPPYLSTEVGTYELYWRLSDYLDVLTVLAGHSFVYFTSNKSSILELCDWIGKHKSIGNPFEGCTKMEFNATVNFSSTYKDIMLYKKAA